jgi:NADH-quinone oxidoreductase subunit A
MSFLLFYVLARSLLVTFLFFISKILSSRLSCAETVSSYECGFEPSGTAHVPFCMKFFLLAILFLVFDVEVAFLFPGLYLSTLFFSFTLVLLIGLLFEYAYGGLSWVL